MLGADAPDGRKSHAMGVCGATGQGGGVGVSKLSGVGLSLIHI
jgi:hypothetical protein